MRIKVNKKLSFETWGIFLQSTGELLDTARSRIGCVSKARKLPKGYYYIDKFIVP
jgi:hypothetical protein